MARRKSWLNREAVRLLRATQERIMRRPKLFDMGEYAQRKSCGTALCIAGNICVLGGARFDVKTDCFLKGKEVVTDPQSFACELLGISIGQSRLFFSTLWPPKFQTAYQIAKGDREIAKIGHAVIEDFIWNKPSKAL